MALQLSENLVCSSHVLPSTRERALNMIGGNTLFNAGVVKYNLNRMLYAPHA